MKVRVSAPCDVLGELVGETATRYVYRRRNVTAFVKKRSPSIHILPCKACADYRAQINAPSLRERGGRGGGEKRTSAQ